MGVRVAYGKRDDIPSAISSGVIPKETIIITNDQTEPELLFYDMDGRLRNIAERTRFESLMEAEVWAKKYDCTGLVFSVHNGADWALFVVGDGGTLSPVHTGGTSGTINITRIDGGTSFGL